MTTLEEKKAAEIDDLAQHLEHLEGRLGYMRGGSLADRMTHIVEQLDALKKLRRGVVASAGRLSHRRAARWFHVAEATTLGSTSASKLCVDAGFDPEEEIGGYPQDGDQDDLDRCREDRQGLIEANREFASAHVSRCQVQRELEAAQARIAALEEECADLKNELRSATS